MEDRTQEEIVFESLYRALGEMQNMNTLESTRSRELSVAITQLETAIMWFDKHRQAQMGQPMDPEV